MKQFLDRKGYLTATAFDLVNWNAIEKAHKLLSHSRHLWAVKFVSGFCGVATKMKSWGYWDSPICPLCKQVNENTSHMICCPDVRSRDRCKKCANKLFKWLKNNDTQPDLVHLLICVINPGTPQLFLQHLHPDWVSSSNYITYPGQNWTSKSLLWSDCNQMDGSTITIFSSNRF